MTTEQLVPDARMEAAACQTISIVVCAYSMRRFELLRFCIESVTSQVGTSPEVVLVIDHNDELYARCCETFADRAVTIIRSLGAPGLATARNTGVRCTTGDVVAFIDDDAIAPPHWCSSLLRGYGPNVLGVGGGASPRWSGDAPRWFPEEFNWVIGCSWAGLPDDAAPVRNLIGTNMSFRRATLDRVGHFNAGLGRIADNFAGCEETELCIRATTSVPDAVLLFDPAIEVVHCVESLRGRLGYFIRRCWSEGLSKAVVRRRVGRQTGLKSERVYVAKVLPARLRQRLARGAFQRDLPALSGAVVIVLGVASASAGYVAGEARAASARLGGGRRNASPARA